MTQEEGNGGVMSREESQQTSKWRFAQWLAAILGALALVVNLAACGSADQPALEKQSAGASSSQPISVVVSVNQWSSIAKQIGGAYVRVSTIINSNSVDAHDFDPEPTDIAKLGEARIVLLNGAGYDTWALNAARTGDPAIVSAASVNGVKTGENPHLWFSARARAAVAKEYYEKLCAAAPAHKDAFAANYAVWQAKEKALDARIAAAAAKLKGKTYAATESVAAYLAADLGLKSVTPTGYVQALQNDSEPSPVDLLEFQKLLETGKAGALVLNTQETSSTTDMIVAAAKKGDVPVIDLTETMPSRYSSLIDWMTALVGQFEGAYGVK